MLINELEGVKIESQYFTRWRWVMLDTRAGFRSEDQHEKGVMVVVAVVCYR